MFFKKKKQEVDDSYDISLTIIVRNGYDEEKMEQIHDKLVDTNKLGVSGISVLEEMPTFITDQIKEKYKVDSIDTPSYLLCRFKGRTLIEEIEKMEKSYRYRLFKSPPMKDYGEIEDRVYHDVRNNGLLYTRDHHEVLRYLERVEETV